MAGFWRKIPILLLIVLAMASFVFAQNNPRVVIETNIGNFTVELFNSQAPITVDNFLDYVNRGFYDYLLFHRIIEGFMIQGGGFYIDENYYIFPRTPDKPAIINESYNGLSNLRGTIAMARAGEPNSATTQFFINHADNLFLDRANADDGFGYCVFGQVTEGMDVVDAIAMVETANIGGGFENFPVNPIVGIYAAYALPCNSPECSDFSGDGKVNFKDFAIFAWYWMNNDCNSANDFCGRCDLNYSGSCDVLDLGVFAGNWLN
ncbi:MAG: peptidylprolyl isomerase [Phycisphaerae bacterium]|nr:peptidylprolyl isomerase [Phycisphaerae bacterium]